MANEDVISKQVDDMLEGLVPDAPPAPEVPEEQAQVEETKTEEVKADESKGEERTEEAPSGQEQDAKPAEEKPKEEVKEPPVVEEKKAEENELERAKRELAETRLRLEELAGKVMSPPRRPQLTPEQQKAAQEEMQKRARQAIKFLQDDGAFDEVMKSSDNFNALLTKVANFAAERVLRMVPQVATTYVDQQLMYKTAAQEFYRENEDLIPHMKYVGYVSNELQSKNANWDLPTLLSETEKEVRARLKLPRSTTKTAQPGRRIETGTTRTVEGNPGFVPGGGGGRRGTVQGNLSGVEKEIADLLS